MFKRETLLGTWMCMKINRKTDIKFPGQEVGCYLYLVPLIRVVLEARPSDSPRPRDALGPPLEFHPHAPDLKQGPGPRGRGCLRRVCASDLCPDLPRAALGLRGWVLSAHSSLR